MHSRLGMFGVHLRVRPLSNRTGVMTRVLETFTMCLAQKGVIKLRVTNIYNLSRGVFTL